jgi:hypothetical protein
MKKLALSVVLLMVAGAGASVSAVGCSSSSAGGAANDSGTPDVTSGDDSGTGSETSDNDSGTPGDTGTTPTEAAAMCDFDAAGSLQIGVDTDAGFVENTPCETCIATNCAQPQCVCLTDTNVVTVDDAGEPGCGAYAGCVYTAFLTNLALSDAGAAGEGADLMAAQTSCAGSFAAGSIASGNALIGCIASSCASSCVQ